MKEIGSEFWSVPIIEKNNRIFSDETTWFLSGRCALRAIIKQLPQIKTVAMPSWCCDTMIKPFVEQGIDVCFYPVYFDNNKIIKKIDYSCDAVLLMDYFGYQNEQNNIDRNKNRKHSLIIRDVTHSFFSREYNDADYYFGSLRKWCGVYTGGYAWSSKGEKINSYGRDDEYVKIRNAAMELKRTYIEARNIDELGDYKKEYLDLYNDAEKKLDYANVEEGFEKDIFGAKHLDVDFLKKTRRDNAEILMEGLTEYLLFPDMSKDDCPLFVPIVVPVSARNELRKELLKNDIYCPIHWTLSRFHKIEKKLQYIYNSEISLICDQRYGRYEMLRIVDVVKSFMERYNVNKSI